MLIENGSKVLSAYAEARFHAQVNEIVPGIWHAVSIGHSNVAIIEGEQGVILIDAVDTLEAGEKIRNIV